MLVIIIKCNRALHTASRRSKEIIDDRAFDEMMDENVGEVDNSTR
jgi:hypothetical protein